MSGRGGDSVNSEDSGAVTLIVRHFELKLALGVVVGVLIATISLWLALAVMMSGAQANMPDVAGLLSVLKVMILLALSLSPIPYLIVWTVAQAGYFTRSTALLVGGALGAVVCVPMLAAGADNWEFWILLAALTLGIVAGSLIARAIALGSFGAVPPDASSRNSRPDD